MDHFTYRDGVLHAEDVPLTQIAEAVGTPVYVYAAATLRRHARVFAEALSVLPSRHIAFAVKANPNVAVLRVLAKEGYGADVVSAGEMDRALGHLRHGLSAPDDRPELLAEDLRLAMRAIGRITGRVDVEELLDFVFRDFCIGK